MEAPETVEPDFDSPAELAAALFGPEPKEFKASGFTPGEKPSAKALTLEDTVREEAERNAKEHAVIYYRSTGEAKFFDFAIGGWVQIVDPGEGREPVAFIATGDKKLDQEQVNSIMERPAEAQPTGAGFSIGYALAMAHAAINHKLKAQADERANR